MLGVGLDTDGHKRITQGENFALVGGTKDTHDEMTEKALKINEKLADRGKRLDDVSREEFDDIAHLRLVATSRWSGPRAFSRIASAR